MKVILAKWQISLLKFSGLAFTAFLVYKSMVAVSKVRSIGELIAEMLIFTFTVMIFAVTGTMCYTGNIATGIMDFLLFPRRYLKVPPVITTRQKGLIAAKKFQLAEDELCDMRREYPESPDVAMMLAELHAGVWKSPETAIADIKYYFKHRRWRYHKLNHIMAMRCADYYQQLGQYAEAVDLLDRESGKKIVYTLRERQVMLDRANAIADTYDI